MNAKQKAVAAAYIAIILYLVHLGSQNVNRALRVLMFAVGSIVIALLVRALYGLIACIFEERNFEEADSP